MATEERWSQLFDMIRRKRTAEFEALLENRDFDLNLQNNEGVSLIHEAVRCRSEAIVKMLSEKEDVNVNIRNKKGRTPLWEAAFLGFKAAVEILLNNVRVDPEARDENDQTPLSAAAMQRGGNLRSAAATAQENVVEALLASGRVDPDAQDARGLTPLAWASRAEKSVRVAEILLSTGRVDANSKDELGITPLMWTAPFHNDKVKELLLNSGGLDEGLKPNTGSAKIIKKTINSRYVTHWMTSCDDHHGEKCKPAPLEDRSPQQLPHWVIDISRACLVAGNTVSRYVALSYVWSQGLYNDFNDKRPPDSILLKKLNLSDFRKPGYLKEVSVQLPTAVKDAIALVRKLGGTYLWVDCLCIVQDDEKTREQVNHMGDIYSGAYLTIIAATPMGRLHGFSSPYYNGCGLDEKVEDLYDDLYSTTWASRGWTFQEQILSKRAVVFNSRYLFWECQQCVWSPDGPRPELTTTGNMSLTVPHFEKASRMLSSCYPDFDLYTEMISLYNSRVFTYPQDVLPAFSGILATLGRNFPSGFQYGLPRVRLDIALLWQPFLKARRRVRRKQNCGNIAPKAHLPSWSWCGWTCPVDPYHLRTRSSFFNQDNGTSQIPVWRTRKLVEWYSLPEDMHCQVPADRLLGTEDGLFKDFKDGISSTVPETHVAGNDGPAEGTAGTVHSACQNSEPSMPLDPTQLSCSVPYAPQPHDTWPFLSCQTSCLSLYIKAVLHSFPASLRQLMRYSPYRSIYKLPQFGKGPTLKNACDLICLETQEGLPAGMLRHMEEAKLGPGGIVELVAISTGTINSTGVEGDEEDKFYRLNMEAYVIGGSGYLKTSEYLEVKKEMELYGEEGPDGREYHFYNVLWVERKEGIAYRRAAGRVPKAIWDADCTPLTKIILG